MATRFIRLLQQYIITETNSSSMAGEIEDADRAIELVRNYAEDECVGEFGEVLDARQENNNWTVEFRTHTFSDSTNIAYSSRPLAIYFHMTVRPKLCNLPRCIPLLSAHYRSEYETSRWKIDTSTDVHHPAQSRTRESISLAHSLWFWL